MTLPKGNYTQDELSWFRGIFDQYYENIRHFAYFKTGDVHLSDDIVQETFIKLWDMRGKVNDSTVKSLLYTIAGNIVKNHYKHLKVVYNFQVSAKSEMTTNTSSADENIRMEQLDGQLQRVLAEIPPGPREVFLMSRIDGLTYDEIASRLGLSVKAIEKRMSEALAIFRKKFGYKV
ncbi:MAG TPA: RNA polymerase subunit sigma-70 [Bacteroidales bacterium]|nr:RNA polymerase subunit sigma-70 [Bacteroidales bacterium]